MKIKNLFKCTVNNFLKIFSFQLNKIKGFLVELSIVKLYSSEVPFNEMIDLLNKLGFELWSLERGFSNKKTGQTLQVNAIFMNKNEI